MSKRAYFLISSLFLTALFFVVSFVSFQWKYAAIIGFSFGVVIYHGILFFSLVKKKRNLIFSSFLPALFTLGISLFRFLFAVSWTWEAVLVIIFLFGIYTLFLMENVFLVSTEIKAVPLYRTANTVSFLMTLVTAFFLYEVLFSFRLPVWQNGLIVFGASLPLLFHFFWSTTLISAFKVNNLVSSLVFSIILGEVALAISFWPLGTTKSALYLTSVSYVFLGLAQAFCQEKLFKQTIREFVLVGLGTFLALFLVTSWH